MLSSLLVVFYYVLYYLEKASLRSLFCLISHVGSTESGNRAPTLVDEGKRLPSQLDKEIQEKKSHRL